MKAIHKKIIKAMWLMESDAVDMLCEELDESQFAIETALGEMLDRELLQESYLGDVELTKKAMHYVKRA